jgi:hypothetical protein
MASSVAVGSAYERAVQTLLASFGARLSVVGGAFDQGSDLIGTWALPNAPRAPARGDRVALQCVVHAPRVVPVVVQCRATATPFGVGAMREFQHAVGSRFAGGALAVVACTSGFALESLVREREWARARTLLLTVSQRGELLAAHSLARAGVEEPREDALAFVVSRVTPGHLE